MHLNPFIFRRYDIRGVVDHDLSDEFAYLLGRAFGDFLYEHNDHTTAVGFDCRFSSRGYAEALCQGLCHQGIDTILIGLGPTPQLYYALANGFSDGTTCASGVQITGSHCPPNMNGFKLSRGVVPLTAEEIQGLRLRMEKMQGQAPVSTPGKLSHQSVNEAYISALVTNCQPHIGPHKLTLVTDCGNGVAGLVGPEMLRRLGVEVVELFSEPDGAFPNHHPDPTVPKNMNTLAAKVREIGAHGGIGWDGDGDRLCVVDHEGNLIFGDLLLLIFGRALLQSCPGARIVADVKSSNRLFNDLRTRGGKVTMWKTGHSEIKHKLQEIDGALGGEFAAHIIFRDRFYGVDDALYAAARLVEILSQSGCPLSELLADLPEMFATPEIHLPCLDVFKSKVIEQLQLAFPEFPTCTIDGVRIETPEGWGLVRASNTTPVLTLRFEATTQEHLAQLQQLVTTRAQTAIATLTSQL